ncbi:Na+/H+ antiporter NhaA [Desulfovibrio psychrotolerans]|uniref:Na(+)/H(+) antiporter NhaA n=1 Tax=Desulfovibrio psychrotolerans TaxID=415242 RepID=A0A7J0BR94_9BACT|nr:Na+/H+ antiporter NhaA [Desulfovibrio psychrotolerans]GFM36190.1 Na(+)/H(+) antiporter NhaA [Desulfovibrio psychrotolerans]
MGHHANIDPRDHYETPCSPVERLLAPFQRFIHAEATGGILLLVCTAIAMLAANSPFSDGWHAMWQKHLIVGPEGYAIDKPLVLWINDGLMVLFFFMVGLEIKREVLVGELASMRQALLPLGAAAGGVIAPALIYLSITGGTPYMHGWAVPVATDIAFALGILSLLGNRVPIQLKVFLAALAIADDICAIIVIALFYTADLSFMALAVGVGALIVAALGNKFGVRRTLFYVVVGLVAWVGFLKSGVHATVAGVLLAFCIPASTRASREDFLATARKIADDFVARQKCSSPMLADPHGHSLVDAMRRASNDAMAPLLRLEHALVPWVAWVVMPIFALANAGVTLGEGTAAATTSAITLGVVFGLAVGKPVGVFFASFIMVKLGLCRLPDGVTWQHIAGTGFLAGIGFTMALFIAQLAFTDAAMLDLAKVGVLGASTLCGVIGWAWLRRLPPANG